MLLNMRGIGKSFAGIPVLHNVNFELHEGEVHLLAGENGAGKSTLIKILGGIYKDYQGRILLDGRETRFHSPLDATNKGIFVIHQELSLIPSLSVMENLFLGREETRIAKWIDRNHQREKARAVLHRMGMGDVNLDETVERFPVSVKQMLEIAKALVVEAKILVMDEPTSALSEPEVDRLFQLIQELKSHRCGVIYISHKMEEFYRIADRITVLRDGECVGSAEAEDLSKDDLVRWMVGRELDHQFPERVASKGKECLRIENLKVPDPTGIRLWVVNDISLVLHEGEILGVAGLRGSGNSELFEGLFAGEEAKIRGKIFLHGREVSIKNPRQAIREGFAWLTNDRKESGLVLGMSITQNVTLAAIRSFLRYGWLLPEIEEAAARRQARDLRIRHASLQQEVGELSGGNQQKVVLAKWLESRPKVLLLDEPTRGVDIGAKNEIYEWINRWTQEGIGIMLITSEMPELLALSDRIIVMHRGAETAELSRAEASAERVLRAAMGETNGV